MRGDLSPQSKCLLGFVLCFIQVLLPILSLNLDLTFPGSKGLHYDIILQTSFGLLNGYQSWSNVWPSEPHFTLKCNPSMLLFCPQNTTTSQALFLSLTFFFCIPSHTYKYVCLCVCVLLFSSQLYASPVWRSGYSPTSSRRRHTRTGHGSHAQNCLNRSQTSTHLLRFQTGEGLQKVEFQWQRANSPSVSFPTQVWAGL